MTPVCIIPARGGSKRIPRKNIRPFLGKPIIAYSIGAALDTKVFDHVIVSTDSLEIKNVAELHGAEGPFLRPEELSDDHTGTDAVVLHALNWLREQGNCPDYVCCIYATAPFLRTSDILRGYEILRKEQAASAFSVTTFDYPVFRSLKLNSEGRLEMFWPEHFAARSQDLPVAYHDAGQFYWARVDDYFEEKRFFSSRAVPVLLPRYVVQDIDTQQDWMLAELKYKLLHK